MSLSVFSPGFSITLCSLFFYTLNPSEAKRQTFYHAFTARPRRGDVEKETQLDKLTESHRIAATATLRP